MGLRAVLMAVCFVAGLALIIVGWKMTGQLLGLGLMIVGLILLLTALLFYNKIYEEPKR